MDVRVAALVGMAAMFAGASRALLASVVFAFETTLQPMGILPLLAGSTLAFLAARLLMQNSIMTEKIARRGLRIPQDYDADVFFQATVGEVMDKNVQTLPASSPISELAQRISRHDPAISVYQAWPLVDAGGQLAGILTRHDLFRALEKPGAADVSLRDAGSTKLVVAHPDETMHEAVARMLTHGVGRLPVVNRDEPRKLIGYLSRTSLLSARLRNLRQETVREEGWLPGLRRS
jgi:CBS domain-containing protein